MSENHPQIAPPASRRTPLLVGIAVLAVLAVVGGLLWARGGDDAAAGGEEATKVVLGTVGASDPYWQTFADAAAEEGIDLDVRDFADYTQPNPALTEGELDVNQFQHLVYLAEYNVANGGDLVPLGSTAIYPLGLYSTQYDSLDEIQDGDTVVVPDDDSNQARGLLILQSAGLITLEDGGSIYSTLADVDEDTSRVEVKAIKADLTPTSLPDVAAAIVNNDFVEKAGLEFEDALATDDAADPQRAPLRQRLRGPGRGPGRPDPAQARRDLPGDAGRARRCPGRLGRHRGAGEGPAGRAADRARQGRGRHRGAAVARTATAAQTRRRSPRCRSSS